MFWGRTAKKRVKYYEIYSADINCENVLDTVFNEEHYAFWVSNIQRALDGIVKKSKGKATLRELNERLKEKGVFEGVDGVMFQDISNDPEMWVEERFQYKKRIQLACFDLSIITNFVFKFEGQ